MKVFFGKKFERTKTRYSGVCTAYAVYDGRTFLLIESIDTTGRPMAEWIDIRELEEKD